MSLIRFFQSGAHNNWQPTRGIKMKKERIIFMLCTLLMMLVVLSFDICSHQTIEKIETNISVVKNLKIKMGWFSI